MTRFGAALTLSVLAAGGVTTSLACHPEAPTPARHGAPHKGSPTAAARTTEYPMIVRVVGRHQAITVTAGPDGPLYSAATSDGKVVAAAATLEQLRQEHPDLYRQLNPSMAVESNDDRGGAARQAGERSKEEGRPEPLSTRIDASRMPLMMGSVE